MLCLKCNTNNLTEYLFCSRCGAALPAVTENLLDKSQPQGSFSQTRSFSWFAPPEENLSGRTLHGKYQLEVKLGAGGAGAVYLGTRLHIGDKVAVKILQSDKSGDTQAAERFRLEARMAAHLKHPNAVVIYDYGVTEDGLRYLVMEFVEGRTLRQLIEHQGALPLPLAVEVNAQICAALDEAHRQGLVHRDVKPDNIIVQETASGLRVKILDFGVAKLLSPGGLKLTQTGMIVGTPRYMSPEQCMSELLDGRSDVYSLGIVLYEMLCGIVPFNAPSFTAIAIQQVTQQPPPLRQINPNVPPAVEAVVLRALEKKRENRPPTAADFASQLSAAATNLPQITKPRVSVNGGATSTNQALRHATNSVNLPLTALMPSYASERQFAPPSSSATANPPRSSRKNTLFLVAALLGFLVLTTTGAAVTWLWHPAPREPDKKPETKISDINLTDKENTVNNDNSGNFDTAPSVNPADEELTHLRNARLNSKSGGIDKIAEEIEIAVTKYPTDYRFPYERAKLTAQLPSHNEAFQALTRAAQTAIKNSQAAQLLSELTRDKVTDFRRMTSHKEWVAIEKALNQKDESLLRKEFYER